MGAGRRRTDHLGWIGPAAEAATWLVWPLVGGTVAIRIVCPRSRIAGPDPREHVAVWSTMTATSVLDTQLPGIIPHGPPVTRLAVLLGSGTAAEGFRLVGIGHDRVLVITHGVAGYELGKV
jgi:hypothetical protein